MIVSGLGDISKLGETITTLVQQLPAQGVTMTDAAGNTKTIMNVVPPVVTYGEVDSSGKTTETGIFDTLTQTKIPDPQYRSKAGLYLALGGGALVLYLLLKKKQPARFGRR
jgi:hypothetical protein